MKTKQYSSPVNPMFMKTSLHTVSIRKWLIRFQLLLIVMTTTVKVSVAQLADCSTGTVFYSIWNDSTGSLAAKPSEIRPVNYTTGAVGALMGGVTFIFSKTLSGTTYYGSASLAVDGITKDFFVNTQMSNPGGKDIIRINTLTNTKTVIGTTPSASTVNVPTSSFTTKGLDDYHFVKMAISPTGTGYAIGVIRDTTLAGYGSTYCNPLISFTTCGVGLPTAGCSTIKLLGFLPNSPSNMTNWQLFNGDIAFNATGDLYFATAAFSKVNGIPRYTNARLFKILSTDIPSTSGIAAIPMSFVADYNTLDSTVINGIAFNPLGAMFLSTRRFNGVQTSPVVTPFFNELYSSTSAGTATIMPGFVRPTVGYSVADVGSCYFPLSVLAINELKLSGSYANGFSNLTWEVNNNAAVDYFEVQNSDDGNDFTTVARVDTKNITQGTQTYTYRDAQSGFGNAKFYRTRQVTLQGARFYSNVLKINFSSIITSISKATPNPFTATLTINAELKTPANITVQLIDNSGRLVTKKSFAGYTGTNKLNLDNIAALQPGLYILETIINGEITREKIIKQ
jgi:Secretion system C-terminal sorting domain